MAEFGIVASSLSIAGLLVNCVQGLEYVQVGRSFGSDFEVHLLKIELVRLRLERWGEAVHVYNRETFQAAHGAGETRTAYLILERIRSSINTAIDKANKYKKTAQPEDLRLFGETDLSASYQSLQSQLRESTKHRQKSTSFARKVVWAIYDKRSLEQTLQNLAELLTALEKLFPMSQTVCQELAQERIEREGNEKHLAKIKEAAEGVSDSAMAEAAKDQTAFLDMNNSARRLRTSDEGKVAIGDQVHPDFVGKEGDANKRAKNYAEVVETSGKGRVLIGNSIGHKSFFD